MPKFVLGSLAIPAACYPKAVNMRFVLGPAGSGKTYRCLAEVRARLASSPDGPPLILLAPKQATFQLERQLLSDPNMEGYVRLHVLSFERLADWTLDALKESVHAPLSEEGRVMVLRALLMRHQSDLEIFGTTARQPGFALELNEILKEFQHYGHSPEGLTTAAQQWPANHPLGRKLRDMAKIGLAFRQWMRTADLQDADALPGLAAAALKKWSRIPPVNGGGPPCLVEGLWMDGFSELTPQELDLLSALAPACRDMTLAFCLENKPVDDISWLSSWSHPAQPFRQCYARLSANASPQIEILQRGGHPGRFDLQPALARLEREWTQTQSSTTVPPPNDPDALRIAVCANPAAETVLAAREIQRFIRQGHRYRDCAVLLRSFEGYKDLLRRVFQRYEIPCFLDRRESVAHHPLAELTRNALRTVAFNWMPKDWFGALKTGLAGATENETDWLENLALARGWQGDQWQQPIELPDYDEREHLEELRVRLMAPFTTLARALGNKPTGGQFAAALREFWRQVDAGAALERWSRDATGASSAVHATVWREMHTWLENLELGFAETALPLRDWLPIVEAGLSGLTVGVVPPALDQVLIGTIDRSRNPDLHLAIVLGLNETVFPAVPGSSGLLSETDRDLLADHGIALGSNQRALMARERYLGYIALTRSRQRLVLSYSSRDAREKPLNPSPFLNRIRRIFPDLKPEEIPASADICNAGHPCELIPPLLADLRADHAANATDAHRIPIEAPLLEPLLQRLRPLAEYNEESSLSAPQAMRLYGATLHTSVSNLESFAMCPFRFFVNAGMRGREREYFELTAREQGTFQHEVLAQFHKTLQNRHQRWRDVAPPEGRVLIGEIGAKVISEFQFGLLQSSPAAAFRAQTLLAALQDYIEVALDWMTTYRFDPVEVELSFGGKTPLLPAWRLPLDETRAVELVGRIDRLDLCKSTEGGPAWFTILDYKSSEKKIDLVLLKNGIQIQLPAYLAALRDTPTPACARWNVKELIPAGAFYINLRGKYKSADTRQEAGQPPLEQHREAAQHRGLFDLGALEKLDANAKTTSPSGQFKAKFTKEDKPWANQNDGRSSVEFRQALDQVTQLIKDFGVRILNGDATVAPYRKGSKTACDFCDAKDICRSDPWTRQYRPIS
jgi:ATP-dependent helicase/nuclease subunit B